MIVGITIIVVIAIAVVTAVGITSELLGDDNSGDDVAIVVQIAAPSLYDSITRTRAPSLFSSYIPTYIPTLNPQSVLQSLFHSTNESSKSN